MPVNLNRLQDEDEEVVDNMEQLAISELGSEKYVPPRYVHPDISRWHPSKISFPPIFIWDQVRSFTFTFMFFPVYPLFPLIVKLRLARNLHYPTRPQGPLPAVLQPLTKPFTRPWDIDFNLHRLRAVHSFKESPGCKSNEFLSALPNLYLSFQLSTE
jgi:hypothetical protein